MQLGDETIANLKIQSGVPDIKTDSIPAKYIVFSLFVTRQRMVGHNKVHTVSVLLVVDETELWLGVGGSNTGRWYCAGKTVCWLQSCNGPN